MSAWPWGMAGRWGLIAAALFALDRLLLWAEDRDWIRYRKRPPSSTGIGTAFLQMQAIVERDKQHIVDQQREIREDEDEDGGSRPPPQGNLPPV